MAHSGSFLERQYCAFAGIARGQNSRDFVAGLVARGYATAITHGSVRRGRIYHVHHKPLYEAIGEPDDRHRKPQTIGRMVQRLMILDGVLGDRSCWWMSSERDKRSYFATTRQTGLSAPGVPADRVRERPAEDHSVLPGQAPDRRPEARSRPPCVPLSRDADPADRLPDVPAAPRGAVPHAAHLDGAGAGPASVLEGCGALQGRPPRRALDADRAAHRGPLGDLLPRAARDRWTHQRPVGRVPHQGVPALRDGAVCQPLPSLAAHGRSHSQGRVIARPPRRTGAQAGVRAKFNC